MDINFIKINTLYTMYFHLPVQLVLVKISNGGGVARKALLNVVYRSKASGSSFDVLSEPNMNAMQL